MKRATISFNIVTVALLVFAGAAVADLIGVNDPSIVGNGMPSQDGNNLTRDTDTGLDWLDMTLSLDRSYNDTATRFGAGADYEGFGFATDDDLDTLFNNAGLPVHVPGPVWPPSLDFLSLFGTEVFDNNVAATAGVFDDRDPDPEVGFAAVGPSDEFCSPVMWVSCSNVSAAIPSLSDPRIGVWLIRPIPEPSSVILCCIGGGLVLAWGSCRQRRRLRHSSL